METFVMFSESKRFIGRSACACNKYQVSFLHGTQEELGSRLYWHGHGILHYCIHTHAQKWTKVSWKYNTIRKISVHLWHLQLACPYFWRFWQDWSTPKPLASSYSLSRRNSVCQCMHAVDFVKMIIAMWAVYDSFWWCFGNKLSACIAFSDNGLSNRVSAKRMAVNFWAMPIIIRSHTLAT